MTYLIVYLLLGLPVAIYAASETRRGYLGLLWIPVAWIGWWIVLAALVWVVLLRIKRAGKCAFCGAAFDGDEGMRAHIASCEKHPLREMARSVDRDALIRILLAFEYMEMDGIFPGGLTADQRSRTAADARLIRNLYAQNLESDENFRNAIREAEAEYMTRVLTGELK